VRSGNGAVGLCLVVVKWSNVLSRSCEVLQGKGEVKYSIGNAWYRKARVG